MNSIQLIGIIVNGLILYLGLQERDRRNQNFYAALSAPGLIMALSDNPNLFVLAPFYPLMSFSSFIGLCIAQNFIPGLDKLLRKL